MLVLPAFFLMAQITLPERVEVLLHHVRPSKVVRLLNEGSFFESRPTFAFDDVRGTVTVTGTPEEVRAAKELLPQFDHMPARVALRLRVESPLDHAEWKADLTLTNNQPWSGSDEATGASLKVAPRVNADGTATLYVQANGADGEKVAFVVRIGQKETDVMSLDAKDPKAIDSLVLKDGDPEPAPPTKGLRVSITYVGLSETPNALP